MNKLIKPQKQSYTGERAQVVAYSDTSEMDWLTNCRLGGLTPAGPGLVPLPLPWWCAVRYYSRLVSSLF